jgi:hypothetical protein
MIKGGEKKMREKKRTFIRIIWINLDNNTKYIYIYGKR